MDEKEVDLTSVQDRIVDNSLKECTVENETKMTRKTTETFLKSIEKIFKIAPQMFLNNSPLCIKRDFLMCW